jgi:hypothetical protein
MTRTIAVLILMLLPALAAAQIRDTIQSPPGSDIYFRRIRELHSNGKPARVWFWSKSKDNENVLRYSEIDRSGKQIWTADSTFDEDGSLRGYVTHIQGTNEHEQVWLDSFGAMFSQTFAVRMDGRYTFFTKHYGRFPSYSAIVDGNPPREITSSSYYFEKAQSLFDRKVSAQARAQHGPK